MSNRATRVLAIGFRRRRYLLSLFVWAAAVNAPFLLAHPDWGIFRSGILRSLCVSLVLFVAPGLACAGPRFGGTWTSWMQFLRVVAASFLVFFGLLVAFRLAGWPLEASAMWTGTWLVSASLMLVRLFSRGPVSWKVSGKLRTSISAAGLFFGCYGLYYFGATQVVPIQHDHDIDTQGPAYGLLHRFEPLMVTDRDTPYYFAHPLLFHFYVGGSFLYHDQLAHLRVFDEISRRYRSSVAGDPIELPDEAVVTTEYGREIAHQIIGVDGRDYLVDPPFADLSRRIGIMTYEVQAHFGHYKRAPHFAANRTPAVFLSALTVAILCQWCSGISQNVWVASLAAAAYATNPEIFVRSSYGGFFAISNFSLAMMLLAHTEWELRASRFSLWNGVLAGTYAALGNHKVILFPASVALFQTSKSIARRHWKGFPKAVLPPVVMGFLLGTALFWLHGAFVDWKTFWVDHVMSHVVDRLVHTDRFNYANPFNPAFVGYPSAAVLWRHFCEHTGYILLPIGLLSLLLGLWIRTDRLNEERLMPNLRLLALWSAVTAAAFSVTDWRQTKHLMPLLIPLHLAPVCLTAIRHFLKPILMLAFAALIVWNVGEIRELAADFAAYPITPGW